MAINRKKTRDAAQKQIRKGNWRKALQYYEELAEDDPSDVRSRLKVADLYSRLGQDDQAVQAYLEVGDYHASQDIYQKAVAVYKQALRLKPEDGDLQRKLGKAYHRLDRLRDATQTYLRALRAYKQEDDVDNQIEVLEQLVRLDTEDIGLRIQLAENYAKASQRDDALAAFRVAASHLYEEGRTDDYVQVAERIIYFDPDDTQTRKRLIRNYIDRDEYKRGLKHLQVCFNANPQDIEILRLLGETFANLERIDKAVMVYRQLAQQYQRQEEPRLARRAWERVLELNPGDPTAEKALQKTDAPSRTGNNQAGNDSRNTQSSRPGMPAQSSGPGQSSGDIVDLSDSIVPVGGDSGDNSGDNSTGINHEDSSPIESRPGTPPSQGPPEDQQPNQAPSPPPTGPAGADSQSGEADTELGETLNEADVFIKYGLYDKARDVLQKLMRMAPDDVRVYDKRRQFYAARGETRAEVETLMRMADMVDEPARAQSFLDEALEKTDEPDRVRQKARQLGLGDGAAAPPADSADTTEEAAAPSPPPSPEPPTAEQADEQTEQDAGSSPGQMMDLGDMDIEFLDASEAEEQPAGADSQSDDQQDDLVALDEAGDEFDFDFDDDEIDSLFAGVTEESEPVNIGTDDRSGDMAEIDFYIQQGLYDEAEEALERFEQANPGHQGVDKRRYQIRTARQGGQLEENPSGAESLSEKFESNVPVDEDSDGHDLGDVDNTNLELGTAYRDMGLYDEAIEEFERALEDPDAAPQAHYNIAVCKAEMGETDDAADTLNSLLQNGELPGDLRLAARQKLQEIGAAPAG